MGTGYVVSSEFVAPILNYCMSFNNSSVTTGLNVAQYGTRHIIEAMQTAGHDIRVIFACGGLSKNEIFIQTHADVTGLCGRLPLYRTPLAPPVVLNPFSTSFIAK